MSRWYRTDEEQRGYDDRKESGRFESYPYEKSHDYREGWDDAAADERRQRERAEERRLEEEMEERRCRELAEMRREEDSRMEQQIQDSDTLQQNDNMECQ
jgi:hypothetical protein